jgi:hypothetical protein
MTDAFDLFWQWAEKPLDSPLGLDAAIYNPVVALSVQDRRDRDRVNEAVARYVPSDEGTDWTRARMSPLLSKTDVL